MPPSHLFDQVWKEELSQTQIALRPVPLLLDSAISARTDPAQSAKSHTAWLAFQPSHPSLCRTADQEIRPYTFRRQAARCPFEGPTERLRRDTERGSLTQSHPRLPRLPGLT